MDGRAIFTEKELFSAAFLSLLVLNILCVVAERVKNLISLFSSRTKGLLFNLTCLKNEPLLCAEDLILEFGMFAKAENITHCSESQCWKKGNQF